MSPELQMLLIAIVFLSQIAVLSFIAPIRLGYFYRKLYDSYPESGFPRFYPVPRAEMERNFNRYTLVRLATGPVGLAALVYGFLSGDPLLFAKIMLVVGMFQVLSTLVVQRWRPGILRAMGKLPPPPRRSAELRRWRITDFVPPALIGLALASILSVFAAVVHVWSVARGDGGMIGFSLFAALPLTTGYLGWMLLRIWKPVSPEQDQAVSSNADLFPQRQRRLRVLFVAATITGLALTYVLILGAGTMGLDFFWTCIGMSILMQVLFLVVPGLAFRTIRSLDFSGYRTA